MIIKKDKQNDYQSNVELEGYDAKISEEDMHKLWDMLQDPYKNPIGAVVREYVSNCFDSHAEAGVTDAVHVKIDKDDTGHYWSCEDFGVGLSPQRMKDVFCSYLKSTKENTNNMIGAFGLGSKSGLSYTDVVHIRTRFEGIEYIYMLCKTDKTPRLEKVFEYETTERNGTQIKIYFKEENDKYRFQVECKKQLCYFDNVYFEGCDVNNDYNILEGEHWKYSTTDVPFSGLHMCIGSVAYPIDWDSLNVDKIYFGAALKFDIGELDIIQTREDVKYTPRTKDAIINKIQSLKEEFTDRWHKQNFDIDDFKDYYDNYRKGKKYHLRFEYDIDSVLLLNIEELYNLEELNQFEYFRFTPFKDLHPNFRIASNAFFEYKCDKKVNENGHLRDSKIGNYNLTQTVLNNYIYRIVDKPSPLKNKYIVEEIVGRSFYFLRVNKNVTLRDYKEHLGLINIPKKEWRYHIETYQKVIKKVILEYTQSYAKVEIAEEWIKDLKESKKTKLEKGKILTTSLVYDYINGSYWSKGIKWSRTEVSLKTLKENNYSVLIGTREEKDYLKHLGAIISKSVTTEAKKRLKNRTSSTDYFSGSIYREEEEIYNSVVFIAQTAQRNVRLFKENLNNVKTVEDFMVKSNLFKKVMTAIYIKKNFENIFNINYKVWEEIYFPIGDYYREIKAAIDKIPISSEVWLSQNALPIALDNNLLDTDLLNKAQFIDNYFKDLTLIKYMSPDIPIIEIAKYIYQFNKSVKNPRRFKKMNIHYYINLNEQEKKWLEANKQETLFIKYKQQVA